MYSTPSHLSDFNSAPWSATSIEINPFSQYIVLEIDEKVSGYIGLWITDNMQIINFYVDKDYQEIILNLKEEIKRIKEIDNSTIVKFFHKNIYSNVFF